MIMGTKIIDTNELVAFAKQVLIYLEAPVNEDQIDWDFLLDQFRLKSKRTTPGLMFLNWSVCKYYNVDSTSVRYNLKGRKGSERKARQIVFYIASKYYDYGPSEIAGFYYVNNRNMNHGTVIHGRKAIEQEIDLNKTLRREIEDITYKLTGYEYRDKITWEGNSTTGILEELSKT